MEVLSQNFKAISWRSLNFGAVNATSFCQIVITSITVVLILFFAGLPGLVLSFSFFPQCLLHLPGPGFLHRLGLLVLNQVLAVMRTRRRNSG